MECPDKTKKPLAGVTLVMRGTDYADARVYGLDGECLGIVTQVIIKPRKLVTVIKVGDETHAATPEELEGIHSAVEKIIDDDRAVLVSNSRIDVSQIEGTKEFEMLSSDGKGNFLNEDERQIKDIIE